MAKQPVATLVRDSASCARWLIKWPSTMKVQGKVYYATTYPDTTSIYVETAVHLRPLSPLSSPLLYAACRAAISRAGGASHGPHRPAALVDRIRVTCPDPRVRVYDAFVDGARVGSWDNKGDAEQYALYHARMFPKPDA